MPTINDGKRALEEGNLQQARLIFEAILQETPRSEEAWLGLADVLTENEDKRVCYENALKINPNSRHAREGLRSLEPQANPFVTALQPTVAVPGEREEYDSDEDITVTQSRAKISGAMQAVETEDAPPTVGLIVLGLALSVVVFVVGSGAVYLLLTNLTG
jgi:thioredoxin-like negative regulator of GroEL